MKMALLRAFAAREVCLVQGGVSAKADAGTDAALLLVPEIAPLLHAGADVGEGAEWDRIFFHNFAFYSLLVLGSQIETVAKSMSCLCSFYGA